MNRMNRTVIDSNSKTAGYGVEPSRAVTIATGTGLNGRTAST